jgi:hypothetical protein
MLQDEDSGRPVSRLLSGLLALAYIGATASLGDIGQTVKMVSFCIVPLVCILVP